MNETLPAARRRAAGRPPRGPPGGFAPRDDARRSPLPTVSEVIARAGFSAAGILAFAASAEVSSEHPLAEAIVYGAHARGLTLTFAEGFRALPGLGVRALVGEADVLVGNRALLAARGVRGGELEEIAARAESRGETALFVVVSGTLAGLITLADRH